MTDIRKRQVGGSNLLTLGQLTATIDACGQAVAYTYDKLGRKTGAFAGSTTGTQLAEWTLIEMWVNTETR